MIRSLSTVLLFATLGCAGEDVTERLKHGGGKDEAEGEGIEGEALAATATSLSTIAAAGQCQTFNAAVKQDFGFACEADLFNQIKINDPCRKPAGTPLNAPQGASTNGGSGVLVNGAYRWLYEKNITVCGARYVARYTYDYTESPLQCGYEVFIKNVSTCKIVGYGVDSKGCYLEEVPRSLADKMTEKRPHKVPAGVSQAQRNILLGNTVTSRIGCEMCHKEVSFDYLDLPARNFWADGKCNYNGTFTVPNSSGTYTAPSGTTIGGVAVGQTPPTTGTTPGSFGGAIGIGSTTTGGTGTGAGTTTTQEWTLTVTGQRYVGTAVSSSPAGISCNGGGSAYAGCAKKYLSGTRVRLTFPNTVKPSSNGPTYTWRFSQCQKAGAAMQRITNKVFDVTVDNNVSCNACYDNDNRTCR